MSSLSDSSGSDRSDFHRVVASFLSQPGLPFSKILSAERIERIFRRHGNLFGESQIYSTAVMVWSFLGQVLRDGKEASCQAAVTRVVSYHNPACNCPDCRKGREYSQQSTGVPGHQPNCMCAGCLQTRTTGQHQPNPAFPVQRGRIPQPQFPGMPQMPGMPQPHITPPHRPGLPGF